MSTCPLSLPLGHVGRSRLPLPPPRLGSSLLPTCVLLPASSYDNRCISPCVPQHRYLDPSLIPNLVSVGLEQTKRTPRGRIQVLRQGMGGAHEGGDLGWWAKPTDQNKKNWSEPVPPAQFVVVLLRFVLAPCSLLNPPRITSRSGWGAAKG